MRRAFTLLELLVAISIAGILLGLLLAAINLVKASAVTAECACKLRQIGIALHAYHDIHRQFPSQVFVQRESWMYKLLPLIDQADLYRMGQCDDPDRYWQTWRTPVPAYICSADASRILLGEYAFSDGFTYSMTSYLGVAGASSEPHRFGISTGIIGENSVRIGEVVNGLSQTLMVGERPPAPDLYYGWEFYHGYDSMLWGIGEAITNPYPTTSGRSDLSGDSCPDRSFFGPGAIANFCDVHHFWSLHSGGGANWLFGDGSVRWLDYSGGETIVPTMANIAGQEVDS